VTRDEIRDAVLRMLGAIAPEADLSNLKPDVAFRDQLDMDSMDFLNFVVSLDKELHVDVPETDYPRISTLNGCVEHIGGLLERR
jgi:acyl carrier protein